MRQQRQRAQVAGPLGHLLGLRRPASLPRSRSMPSRQAKSSCRRREMTRQRGRSPRVSSSSSASRVTSCQRRSASAGWLLPGPVGGARVPARRFQRLAALLHVVGDQRRQLVVAVRVELDRSPGRRRRGSPRDGRRAGCRRRPRGSADGGRRRPVRGTSRLRRGTRSRSARRAAGSISLVARARRSAAARCAPSSLPTTEATWSSALASGPSRSIRAARIACTVGRHAGVLDRARQPVGAALALQVAGLGQLADDLLDEERVALGALVDQLAEAVERGVLAGQVAQQLQRVRLAERLERDLAVGARRSTTGVYSGR